MASKRARDRRVPFTCMVAPHTLARIKLVARKTGASEGRVVDTGIDALDECEACEGSGRSRAAVLGVRDACSACGGHGFVPRPTT